MSRILVVEDSQTQAAHVCCNLEADGHEAIWTDDGAKAIELLRTESFELVLSDVVMAGISGYELCQRIKADPATNDLPVILLTSLDHPMDVIQGLECGADNFLAKPFEPEHLIARSEHHREQSRPLTPSASCRHRYHADGAAGHRDVRKGTDPGG